MKRFFLSLLLLLPLSASAQENDLSKQQQDAFKRVVILGRVQAGCSFYNARVLAPAYAESFITEQLKQLPKNGKDLLTAMKQQDPTCAELFQ